jgi:PAS domain S-box-containing protein
MLRRLWEKTTHRASEGPPRQPRRRIMLRTVVLALGVTLFTLGMFVVGTIPYQKRLLVQSMESKAEVLATSVSQVTVTSIITEDYTAVIEHCMKVVKERPTVSYLVLVKKDGFSLIHTREGWRQEQLSGFWTRAERGAKGMFIKSPFTEEQVYRYRYPVEYSGIKWGWMNIAFSLDAFSAGVRMIYLRTVLLAGFCLVCGLIVSLVFARRLSRPLLLLEEFTRRVAAGDLSSRVNVSSGDEVESLAESFNRMVSSLQVITASRDALNQEIAERKQAEEALQESEGKYKTLLVGAAEGILVADLKTKQLRYGNPAVCRMFGYTEEELMRLRVADMHPRESLDHVLAEFETQLRGEKTLAPDLPCLRKDGTLFYANVSGTPMVIDGHECNVGFFTDITERKKAEEVVVKARRQAEEKAKELQKVNKQLSRAVAEKDDFLRAVSHDLSAPLRNIGGMAAFLKSQYAGCLDETGRDRIERILNNVAVQNGLIQDLLELSHIKTRPGKVQRTDLNAMLRALVDQFSFDLEKKSGRIDFSGEFPVIWCETNRIRQVFQNLIDNAIKYAHPDRPLQVAVIGQRDDHGYRFTVADNGIGMRKEDTEAIFFVFRRVRNAYTAKIEGKGVGLATVKSIVESHGGEIWVESQEGFGSSFVFTLPATAVGAPPDQETESVSAT